MPSFIPLQAAYDELDALYESDEDGAALIDVLFETLSEDAENCPGCANQITTTPTRPRLKSSALPRCSGLAKTSTPSRSGM